MIKNLTLYTFKKAINLAISRDENTLEKINALDNKVMQLIIAPLNIKLFFVFGGEVDILADYKDKVDVTITSSPLGFIRLSILPTSKVRSLFNDEVKITGDVELGHKIKKIFDEVCIDWEGHLADLTGDVVAYQIGSVVRKGMSFAKSAKRSLKRNMTEYLQEELRLVPTEEELEDFFLEVDELALQVERMTAHLEHLKVKHETN